MTNKERMFVKEIETVSASLSLWVREMLQSGWSIQDCKVRIFDAAKVAGRE